MKFKLKTNFQPTGDQPQAIEKLTRGVKKGKRHQVLLGTTGSGKTFAIANVIQNVQKPTLVISHNKTLAAQLYQEFRDFFPKNAVSYFVSYYDYYQPEAYIPQTDTYIQKETSINEEIDRLRLEATSNLLSRADNIVVASVSCIYNLGSPREYGHYVLELVLNEEKDRQEILKNLVRLNYQRSKNELFRSSFRVRGDVIEVWPAYRENSLKITLLPRTMQLVRGLQNKVSKLEICNPISGQVQEKVSSFIIYPAKHFMTNPNTFPDVFGEIKQDLKTRLKELKKEGKVLEAKRLETRVNYDLEMIQELGFVNGIENYSRYFDGRLAGEPPSTLLNYFQENSQRFKDKKDDFLIVIDESHITIPQIKGMYRGDLARKKVLIEHGFRLPSCLDNRPLRFPEFLKRAPQLIYTSATPDRWEKSRGPVIEQLIRPTGLVDPEIYVRNSQGQVEDLTKEILKCKARRERVLVITLTKRMAEALSSYLKNLETRPKIKVHYLHSEIQTLERQDILDDLRLGKYDVIVGINLLREGLDLPEVALVAILDADKEGFLRSQTSLIQVMGRAARHLNSRIIMYADRETGAMKEAIAEVKRRRRIQVTYNKQHHITPTSIQKPVREKLIKRRVKKQKKPQTLRQLTSIDFTQLTPEEKANHIKKLKSLMNQAARNLEFEKAALLRDELKKITDL